jgi:hypothetical protein
MELYAHNAPFGDRLIIELDAEAANALHRWMQTAEPLDGRTPAGYRETLDRLLTILNTYGAGDPLDQFAPPQDGPEYEVRPIGRSSQDAEWLDAPPYEIVNRAGVRVRGPISDEFTATYICRTLNGEKFAPFQTAEEVMARDG